MKAPQEAKQNRLDYVTECFSSLSHSLEELKSLIQSLPASSKSPLSYRAGVAGSAAGNPSFKPSGSDRMHFAARER